MGVHGLWELLAPVGRRVSVETLAGKKLAIDASIWMIQFIKAMRDDRGEMVRNAHILGFFRRICKLLFLRTKPVFVFDGGTPALKRRTVIARRRHRENAQAKIRKTAEKLLLNHLKAMRLKELANDLENQRQNSSAMGKTITTDNTNTSAETSGRKEASSKSLNQEALDEMLAASLAAEGDDSFSGGASISGTGVLAAEDDYDEDEDEEILLPALHGKVDPAVLAALPPSMQLDLLVQMRERLMAENRQKYQKVKKAPAKFSELQIQAYLKTVAFRRDIDEVQKSAGGKGIGGVQTSRIASEANRRYIFSSSFTGSRQILASAGVEENVSEKIPTMPTPDLFNGGAPSKNSNSVIGSTIDEPRRAFSSDVETYVDGRGLIRVSKVRAMGIRMTRDLQRNLDLMKEIEQQRSVPAERASDKFSPDTANSGSVTGLPAKSQTLDTSNQEKSLPITGTSIEVSFQDGKCYDSDDAVFAQIVTGDPLTSLFAGNTSSRTQIIDSVSECEWEEGAADNANIGTMPPLVERNASDEGEVEWEEESFDVPVQTSISLTECRDTISKGALEEEADLQEAIKRSVEDQRCQKSNNVTSESEISKDGRELASEDAVNSSDLEKDTTEPGLTVEDGCQNMEISFQGLTGVDEVDAVGAAITSPAEEKGINSCKEMQMGSNSGNSEVAFSKKSHSGVTSQMDGDGFPSADAQQSELHVASDDNSKELIDASVSLIRKSKNDVQGVLKFDDKSEGVEFAMEIGGSTVNEDLTSVRKMKQVEITEASLEEEWINLTKERIDLGDEQRKLERNAESVSSEMFVECQELLQMFGLPYIIAPMEAEAQCAYMELENLVDGVVTDDADVFLFGARSVYKNIFDDRKYVETYFMKDIESELGLTREKLIHMALLLGSDYTEGISGIGIVNAIEVLNAFPEVGGLHKFREWIESPDPTILGKIDFHDGSNSRKKDLSANFERISPPIEGILESANDIQSKKQIFMDKHRNVSKNWHVPSSFPSEAVISAYAYPEVDKSTEPFLWGKPDLFVLRRLCWEKFGWVTQKADELLQPVLTEYNRHETQLRLEAFYMFNERFAKIRSKRINKAVKGITGSRSLELTSDSVQNSFKGRKRRKGRKEGDDYPDPYVEEVGRKSTKKKASNVGGRGRARGRGIVRRRGTNENSVLESSGTSSDDGNDSNAVEEVPVERYDGPHEVRKSTRARNAVKYTEDGFESDELVKLNQTVSSSAQEDISGNISDKGKGTFVTANAAAATDAGPSGSNTDDTYKKVDTAERGRMTGQEADAEFLSDPECSKDYLKLGGGFCLEDEVDDTEPSKDYLKMGRGFCLEEGEEDKEPNRSPCSPLKAQSVESEDISQCSGFVVEAEKNDFGPVHRREIKAYENTQKIGGVSADDLDFRTRPVRLTGMPNLRRKRRRGS